MIKKGGDYAQTFINENNSYIELKYETKKDIKHNMINKDFEDFFKILNRNNVEYLVIGGYAHIYYTEPRYTKDLDILINPTKENAERVYKSICEFFGVEKLEGYSSDIFTKKYPDGHFAFGMGAVPNCIEIFTNIPGIEFKSAWRRRQHARYGDADIWLLSRKDLEKNFKAVAKKNQLLAKKYGYFLKELKRYEK